MQSSRQVYRNKHGQTTKYKKKISEIFYGMTESHKQTRCLWIQLSLNIFHRDPTCQQRHRLLIAAQSLLHCQGPIQELISHLISHFHVTMRCTSTKQGQAIHRSHHRLTAQAYVMDMGWKFEGCSEWNFQPDALTVVSLHLQIQMAILRGKTFQWGGRNPGSD
jgi:hypothetical protein